MADLVERPTLATQLHDPRAPFSLLSGQAASGHPLVCDNYGTRKHPTVRAWLARNPRITLHFTPPAGPG